ncbi:MAG: rod-binding protein [Sphingobium sp.]|nr:rod-binding protein [Sphingobium sp.]MCP5400725.1 rod-binding protein [Sphingomonas sp.]
MHIAGTTPISATNGANGQPSAKKAELEQAAKAFEAIFLRQMIGAMRSSSLAEGLFDNSATEQFRDMADARTADEMAKTSKFGIAELLLQQFGVKAPVTPSQAPASLPLKGDEQ